MSTDNDPVEEIDESAAEELLADAVAEAADAIAADTDSEEPSEEADDADPTAERDQYFDQWKRTQAELENFRKRSQRELEMI